jgi:hypothetical protein
MTTSTTIPKLATTDESPHACDDGWVTIGQLVLDPETGEETEEYARYLCRRCADSRWPRPDSSGSYHQRGRRLFARAGALRAAASIMLPQATSFLPIVLGAVFALRPLCVARDLVWCEHDYPRWGGHTPESIVTSAVLGASASIMGSELLQGPL